MKPTKQITFTWTRGCMDQSESRTTVLKIADPNYEAEEVLTHVMVEMARRTIDSPFEARWTLDSWEHATI
jgi:hypothetical protein